MLHLTGPVVRFVCLPLRLFLSPRVPHVIVLTTKRKRTILPYLLSFSFSYFIRFLNSADSDVIHVVPFSTSTPPSSNQYIPILSWRRRMVSVRFCFVLMCVGWCMALVFFFELGIVRKYWIEGCLSFCICAVFYFFAHVGWKRFVIDLYLRGDVPLIIGLGSVLIFVLRHSHVMLLFESRIFSTGMSTCCLYVLGSLKDCQVILEEAKAYLVPERQFVFAGFISWLVGFCDPFMVAVLEDKDGTISVASAFAGHQEG